MSLQGKTAVVIGASGQHNFGVAIARRLAQNGAKVVVSGRRLEPLQALAKEIDGLAIACDMSDAASIEALFSAAKAQTGRVDIAINSAGGTRRKPDRNAHPRTDSTHIRRELYRRPAMLSLRRRGHDRRRLDYHHLLPNRATTRGQH